MKPIIYSAPYGFCPKCNSLLVYNDYNKTLECSNEDCEYWRDFTKEDHQSVDDELAQDLLRRLRYDEACRVAQYQSEDYGAMENIFDRTSDPRK